MINLQKEKSWQIINEDTEKVSALSKALSINEKIAAILINRGMDTLENAKKFLYGGINVMHNPFLFEDMQKAADRIRIAVDRREQILVYGDRDVDGITAVNVIVNTIRLLGGNVQWYVPADEGYGIHKDILTKYAAENVKLMITVDCGISAIEEIEYAKNLGMDVILTDHHEPPYEGVPNAYAIINPKTLNSGYPFKDIAGCAVALKTAQALMLTFGKEYNKEILICHVTENNGDFKGSYIILKNNIEIVKNNFNSVSEIKPFIKLAFRVYTNNNDFLKFIIEGDVLLNSKVKLIESSSENIDMFLEDYINYIIKEDGRMKEFFDNNLDLCALGTIADSMPLIDENRAFVTEGLKIIANNPDAKPGLGLLIKDTLQAKNMHPINARTISWNITPVLNSSGRMGRGMLSAQLLMTKDAFQAKNLYADIIKLNEDRRWLQSENIEQFQLLLKQQCDIQNDKAFIIKASDLEHGVTGIVASQIVKTYSKPAFLLITDGTEAIGAARSVEGFDLVAALESAKDILIKYGGHSQAAGFTIEHSKIPEFKKRILEYAEINLVDKELSQDIIIDHELKVSDISVDFYNQLEILEPFGMANPRPVFCIKGVSATEISVFGARSEHMKFKISQKGSRKVQAVFWNNASFAKMIRSENLDIAFHLEVIGRQDKQIAQMCVVDIKASY